MADSDDEYDRKRRDKFRGERGSTGGGGLGTGGGGLGDRRDERSRHARDEWSDRSRSRTEYRGPRGYSPGREPPPSKRSRTEWPPDERRYGPPPHDTYGSYGWAHDHYGHHPAHQTPLHSSRPSQRDGAGGAASGDSQPSVMTFKAFLAAQDDSITDEEAIKKYNEYKCDFRRQQLNEFFIAHKDEEWFKMKYHPEESLRRKEEQQKSLKNRLDVFIDLLENNYYDKVTIDIDQSDQLVKLLDTVVIKLEGGTDEDLKVLDEKPEPPPDNSVVIVDNNTIEIVDDKVDNIKKEDEKSEEVEKIKEETDKKEKGDSAPLNMEIDPHHKELQEQAKIFSTFNSNNKESTEERKEKPYPTSKRKRRNSGESSGSSSGSSSSSSSSSDSSDSEAEDGNKEEELRPPGENEDEVEQKPIIQKTNGDNSNVDEETKETPEKIEAPENLSENKDEVNKKSEPEKPERREMHKTTSIFLRNLSPSITKAEVEAMCRRYGGFLRVALADPLPDRRWFRRGWVSFKREVNIKDICWNLNNIRLKDCELGAIVNRDLSRRIRPVNGITLHKQIVRSDARLAARLCYHLDARANLWNTKITNTQSDIFNQFDLQSSNPVLHNITEYLIEEASAEEEELLGLNTSNTNSETNADGTESTIAEVERDPQLTSVLDRLILYLRVVHSVDYYNHCEYPYEDEMPNRCGIMHARGPPPSAKPTPNDISEYIKTFEGKMASFLQESPSVDNDELEKLGNKDPQGEVEKFIQANTQELAKDKWLCPLSGKKFKGPDFIRKHIFNKHAEKVEEVKKEVEYFNNYLRDAKRPQLQESSSSSRRPESSQSSSFPPAEYGAYGAYSRTPYGYHPPYGYPPPAYPPPIPYSSSRHSRSYNRGRGPASDFRPVIHYRDLDAPREPEDFI